MSVHRDKDRADDIVAVEVRGLRVLLRAGTSMERYRAATYETKEPETLDWLERFHGPEDVLFDVGANVGIYTLFAALRNPAGLVIAFEPAPRNCAALLDNVGLNQTSNVHVWSLALAAVQKLDLFYLSSGEAGASMHSLGSDGPVVAFGESVACRLGVISTTLDELIAAGLPAPTLLKLDVDGTEENVLRGAMETLRSRSLRSVLVELNWTAGGSGEVALRLVEEAGFRLRKMGRMWQRGSMTWQNYIFTRPRRCRR